MALAGDRALDLAPTGRGFDAECDRRLAAPLLPDVGLDFDRKPRGATVVGAYASGAPADRRRFALPDAESGPAPWSRTDSPARDAGPGMRGWVR